MTPELQRLLRVVKPRDLADLYRAAWEAGCEVRRGGRHVLVITPSGERVTGSLTASDHRSRLNIRAKIRRAGVLV